MVPWRAALRDHALHAFAWALLRTTSPASCHSLLLRVGARLSPVETADEARRVMRSLSRHGTCLSRCLAVAARAPTADVAIGVQPGGGPLFAHAWLEMEGVPIDPAEVRGALIARLRGPRSQPAAPGDRIPSRR